MAQEIQKNERPLTNLEKAMGVSFGAPSALKRLESLVQMDSISLAILAGEIRPPYTDVLHLIDSTTPGRATVIFGFAD